MRDLQQLCRDNERERAEYSLDRSELESRISTLETLVSTKDKMLKDYLRRISLLEYALRSERLRRDGCQLAPVELDQRSPVSGSGEPINSPQSTHNPVADAVARKPRTKSCKQILRRYLQDILHCDESRVSQLSGDVSSPLDVSAELITETRLLSEWRPSLKVNCSLEGVRCLQADPSGRSLLFTGGDEGLVCVWNLAPVDFGRPQTQEDPEPEAVVTLRGHQGPVTTLNYFPASSALLTSGVDGTLRILKISNISTYDPYGSEIDQPIASQTFYGHDDAIWAVKVKDASVVTAGAEGVVSLWSLGLGEKLTLVKESSFSLPNEVPTALAWHPFEAGKIISAFKSSTVALFDASAGQLVKSYAAPSSGANCAESFSNFACLSVGFRDGFVRTLDLNAGEWVSGFAAHNSVTALALTDSKYLATGGANGHVAFWDLRNTSTAVHTVQLNNTRYDEGVTSLYFSDRLLVVGGADGSVNYLSLDR